MDTKPRPDDTSTKATPQSETPPIPFDLRPESGTPIYRQLYDQVVGLVASGQLRPGELLPSVRTVASQAGINPMTVSKAYTRLEAGGLVERVRGRGMRVIEPTPDSAASTSSASDHEETFNQIARPALHHLLHRARQLGLSQDQVRQVIETILQESDPLRETPKR